MKRYARAHVWSCALFLALLIVALSFGVRAALSRIGPVVHAAGVADFIATDDAGPWFQCVSGGCVQAGTQSLAVVNPGTDVRITVGSETGTVHTFTSLVFPTGAQHMPFDQAKAFRASSRT